MDGFDDRDAISEFMDADQPIHHDIVPVSDRANMVVHSDDIDVNVKADYDQTRRSMKAVIDAGTDAVDKLVKVAVESESPRAYEVLSQTLKTITEMNQALMSLHKDARELSGQKAADPHTVNNTAVLFNGSTEELQRFLDGKS